MITLETISLVLAIVAIILAVGAVVAEIAFFIIQTSQANEVRKDNAEFAKEMHGLLGELKGHAVATREELERRYQQVLNAALRNQGQAVEEAVETETSETVQRLLERLSTLEGSGEGAVKRDEVQQEIDDLREEIASLKETVPRAARRSAESATSDARVELGSSWATFLRDLYPTLKRDEGFD